MSAVGADPRAYRLVMHTQPNLTAAHALLCKSQRLCHARLIGLPGLWLRGKVQLAPTTAEALAPRPILPALEDLCCLPTLGQAGRMLLHALATAALGSTAISLLLSSVPSLCRSAEPG